MPTDESPKPDIYTELPPKLAGYDARSHVRIADPNKADTIRASVIYYIWPEGALPVGKLPSVLESWEGPGALPSDLEGTDPDLVSGAERLEVLVDFGYHHWSYLLHPVYGSRAKRLVILHQGHQGGLVDGIDALANHLLRLGFTVALMQMPLVGWNTENTFRTPNGEVTIGERSTAGHNRMVSVLEGQGGSALRFFIEPVVAVINYFIRETRDREDISMMGLSGGGWTTHVAAAVDTRIKLSVPVAGSYPLYLRPYYPGSIGDAEQLIPALYEERASWLDLYILGGYGEGRRQIQLLNQYDTCCFYGIGHTTYAGVVSDVVERLGEGSWECVLDSSHKSHVISDWAVRTVIDPVLAGK